MNATDLLTASVSAVAALTAHDHAALANALAERGAELKRMNAVLDAALVQTYGGQNAPGTYHDERDGVKVKIGIGKRVEWDSDMLEDMATDPSVAEYIDCKVSIPEARYKAMPDRIRKAVEGARTVKMAKPSFEFKED